MTDSHSPLADNERLLVAHAGGYLRNTVREPGVTCAVCTTPVRGFHLCFRCQRHSATVGIADLVVPLAYAIDRTQSGNLLRHYKDDPSAAVRARHRRTVRRLLYVGLMRHQRCIENQVGMKINARVAVPSLRQRPGIHPFLEITRGMNAVDDRLALVPIETSGGSRIVSAGQFDIAPVRDLRGRHVVILDDTWTTGSNTQSAALTLRAAGAERVSIVVVARWLSPAYDHNAEFIGARLQRDYNPRLCPVTGERCP